MRTSCRVVNMCVRVRACECVCLCYRVGSLHLVRACAGVRECVRAQHETRIYVVLWLGRWWCVWAYRITPLHLCCGERTAGAWHVRRYVYDWHHKHTHSASPLPSTITHTRKTPRRPPTTVRNIVLYLGAFVCRFTRAACIISGAR